MCITIFFWTGVENLAFGTAYSPIYERFYWSPWLRNTYCQVLDTFTFANFLYKQRLISELMNYCFHHSVTFPCCWDVLFLFGCLLGLMIDLLHPLLEFWVLELVIQWWDYGLSISLSHQLLFSNSLLYFPAMIV